MTGRRPAGAPPSPATRTVIRAMAGSRGSSEGGKWGTGIVAPGSKRSRRTSRTAMGASTMARRCRRRAAGPLAVGARHRWWTSGPHPTSPRVAPTVAGPGSASRRGDRSATRRVRSRCGLGSVCAHHGLPPAAGGPCPPRRPPVWIGTLGESSGSDRVPLGRSDHHLIPTHVAVVPNLYGRRVSTALAALSVRAPLPE